ncbi:MAG: hypothetical protein AB1813_10735 [Verrucomicrobiota bacterium]
MKTAPASSANNKTPFQFPLDLSEWVPAETLWHWSQAEVESLNWSDPEVTRFLERQPQGHPKELLQALGFAYATGLFASDEISRSWPVHPFLKQLIPADNPDPTLIERFRRENRGLLKWLIVQLLKRVFRERFSWDQLMPAGLKRGIVEEAVARLDIARHMDRGD